MRKAWYILAVTLSITSIPGVLCAVEEPAQSAVVITAPPNHSVIKGKEVDIAVNFASPEGKPVSKVQVYLDGKYITERTYDSDVAKGTCTFRWDTTRTQNGDHRIDAQAFSKDEYVGMGSCTVSVLNEVVDIEAPRVAVNLRDGQSVAGVTPIEVAANDNSGREPMVSIFIDQSLRTVKNRSPYSFDWDTTTESNGQHIVQVTAADDANNQSAKSVKVIVRNQTQTASAITPSTLEVAVPKAAMTCAAQTPAEHQSGNKEVARASAGTEGSFEVGQTAATKATQSTHKVSSPAPKPRPVQAKAAPAPVSKPVTMAKADTKPEIPAPAAEVNRTVKAERKVADAGHVYTMQEGDCIDTLSKKLGVPVKSLMALNDIEDPKRIQIGTKIRIPSDVKMIPIRPAFESAGGTLTWNGGKAHTVRATSSDKDVTLKIGSSKALVNSKPVTMDKPAAVNAGRTMVPSTFVTRTLGMSAAEK